MTMTRLALGFVCVIAVIGVAASLVVQHSSEAKLSEQAETARQQAEQITQLSAENGRLSNLVVQAGSSQPLSPDQLSELLRLRGQLGRLRQAAQELAHLEAANQQLRAAQSTAAQQLAAARSAPNFWPKDQLAFAGYADPEATVKTLLWAMKNGDLKAYLACHGSEQEVNEMLASIPGEKAEAEIASSGKMLSDSLAPAVGFRILDKKSSSADEVILHLSFDGEGKVRKFVLKRAGDEWKVKDMLIH